MDEGRMARDVEVLQQVMGAHGMTVLTLANQTHLAQQTIYKYLTGDRTLPSDVLRAAFGLTGDLRLLQLISGDIPINFQLHDQTPPQEPAEPTNGRRRTRMRVPPLHDVLPKTLDAAEKVVRCGRYMTRIFADRQVDRRDLPDIERFQQAISDARGLLAECDAGVERAREGISVGN